MKPVVDTGVAESGANIGARSITRTALPSRSGARQGSPGSERSQVVPVNRSLNPYPVIEASCFVRPPVHVHACFQKPRQRLCVIDSVRLPEVVPSLTFAHRAPGLSLDTTSEVFRRNAPAPAGEI